MISKAEREYLRELAKQQLELANSPDMKEKEKLWYDHNEGKGSRPMIATDEWNFWKEICPKLQCEDPLARELENQMLNHILRVEFIGDDKVTPDFYRLSYVLWERMFGLDSGIERAKEGFGYHFIPQIEVIEEDFGKLSPTKWVYKKEKLEAKKAQIEEVIGDILPVKTVNSSNEWGPSPMQKVVELMGMENAYCSMMSEPEEFHRLINFITEDVLRLYQFEEENGCVPLNNGNDYTGSGNWCFSRELPGENFDGTVRTINTWGYVDAEDAVGISPEMFREFVLPYQKRIAERFGLLYYGCCEPASKFWENGIDQIPNIRKVSISEWCDEAFMAERLAETNMIYCRKPSVNFFSVNTVFDEEAFRQNIRRTVELTKGCQTEFSFRSILTLKGNSGKMKRAIDIVREETRESYCKRRTI